LPDLPDLLDLLPLREPEGLELLRGAEGFEKLLKVEGRAKLRDGVDRLGRKLEEDLLDLDRNIDREGLFPEERDIVELLVVFLDVLLVTEGVRPLGSELRDSSRLEVRGTSALRVGIVVMRPFEPLSRDVFRALVAPWAGPASPVRSGAGERLSILGIGVLVDVLPAGEAPGAW
jgi:hypothetical protein